MKKIFTAIAATLLLTACGGSKSAESQQPAEDFNSPLPSGNYRAVSFQYGDLPTDRTRFDGRILMALDPDNSGMYIYENGNRTDFKAAITLSQPFTQQDSVFVALDSKERPVTYILGADIDTLMFTKGEKVVKVAFEHKPMSEMTPQAAWQQITSKLK